jgi:hypothetical protein
MALLFSSQFSAHAPRYAETIFSGKAPFRAPNLRNVTSTRVAWTVVCVTSDVRGIDAFSVEEDYGGLQAYMHL